MEKQQARSSLCLGKDQGPQTQWLDSWLLLTGSGDVHTELLFNWE